MSERGWILQNVLFYFIFYKYLWQMFHGTHYIGDDIVAHFSEGEAWRKVFGPIFIYLNSTPSVSNAHGFWIDEKRQVTIYYPTTIFPLNICIVVCLVVLYLSIISIKQNDSLFLLDLFLLFSFCIHAHTRHRG